MKQIDENFTPALGKHELSDHYDGVISFMTRERAFRKRLLDALAPAPGQTIVDIGSGTGSFAILVKHAVPDVRIIAVDPDQNIRKIAEDKAGKANVEICFVTAMGHERLVNIEPGTVDQITSSLVLHQCPTKAKKGILANAFTLLKPGGRLLIMDYGNQRSPLMWLLFNQVRMVDGYEDTRASKNGKIPRFIEQAGFVQVEELSTMATPTGSLSLYSAYKPR